ncbi:hypothetical protein DPMN_106007 [Dreissena polymorpha]|uniref:Uncharacterized protein n=1 Tax=Dreissena polymorpha TaxID=45954 RepID=A0A9D4K475_DREPO|nr:hypothetical protein DPMN_106007 [Dreissena polymorpha]
MSTPHLSVEEQRGKPCSPFCLKKLNIHDHFRHGGNVRRLVDENLKVHQGLHIFKIVIPYLTPHCLLDELLRCRFVVLTMIHVV